MGMDQNKFSAVASQAHRAAKDSLKMYQEIGEPDNFDVASTLLALAMAQFACGWTGEAIFRAQDVCDIFRGLGNVSGQGSALSILAQALFSEDEVKEAVSTAKAMQALLEKAGDQRGEANAKSLIQRFGGEKQSAPLRKEQNEQQKKQAAKPQRSTTDVANRNMKTGRTIMHYREFEGRAVFAG